MPKLDTAQHLGLPVHAPEPAYVPSQTLAHSQQYSWSGLFDRGSFRQDLRDRVLHAQAFLGALAFRHVGLCGDNLDKFPARGEHRLTDRVEVFDCSIGQYDSVSDRESSLLG